VWDMCTKIETSLSELLSSYLAYAKSHLTARLAALQKKTDFLPKSDDYVAVEPTKACTDCTGDHKTKSTPAGAASSNTFALDRKSIFRPAPATVFDNRDSRIWRCISFCLKGLGLTVLPLSFGWRSVGHVDTRRVAGTRSSKPLLSHRPRHRSKFSRGC